MLDSDPSIRWQALRDLTDASADEVRTERARVAPRARARGCSPSKKPTEDGEAQLGNRGWNSTMHVLMLLRDMGLDPSGDQARRAMGIIRERVTWLGCGP